MPTVRIPTPLRSYTGGREEVEASGSTLRELIEDVEQRHPGLKARLVDEQGALRRYVNLFVGDEDARFLKGLDTELKPDTRVSIVPAIAGGSAC